MPRIHRPTAQRREEILDAAHTLFTTKGFQPTTMEAVSYTHLTLPTKRIV